MLSKAHRMIDVFSDRTLSSVFAEAARFQPDIGGEDGHEGSAAIKMMVILTLLSLPAGF